VQTNPARAASVRVFLCTYRRHNLLRRAVASLLDQSCRDWVCELHNDAPGDPFPRELVAEIGDQRISVFDHPSNLGGVGTFNLMFSTHTERYISLLEDDNWWEPNFLDLMIREMDAHSSVAVGWANMQIWKEEADRSWRNTGRLVWENVSAPRAVLFEWPDSRQAWRALHSTGSMLVRTGALDALRIPTQTKFDFADPVRERAMPHPLLFMPQPLVNFALTIDTARQRTRDGILEHYVLLIVSFFKHVRLERAMAEEIWNELRKSTVRSTDMLIVAGLYARECRLLLRCARLREWVGFAFAVFRRPLLFWRGMNACKRNPEVWAYLDLHTGQRCRQGVKAN
jgi:glycosyltransferase involved in cell wall biosynthesis